LFGNSFGRSRDAVGFKNKQNRGQDLKVSGPLAEAVGDAAQKCVTPWRRKQRRGLRYGCQLSIGQS
jgi:hypothetical protein